MKCPKCSYLGFETGDRCKNCGYDFSLMPAEEVPSSPLKPDLEYDYDSDLVLRDSEPAAPSSSEWFDEIDTGLSASQQAERSDIPRMTLAEKASAVGAPPSPALPLFTPGRADDDEPLVRLPAKPRQPLAVRRTPIARRPPISKHILRQTPGRDHVLLFGEEPEAGTKATVETKAPVELPLANPAQTEPDYEEPVLELAPDLVGAFLPSGVRPRVVAALIDHGILLAIDLVVLYFTLRMAALTMGDWRMLPPVPLLAFLGMVKLAYFSAFTAVGGQTIGKMAAGIRVVGTDEGSLEVSRAVQRAAAVLVSLITLGIGFLPVLFDSDRRALHDRVARTRVVTLPSA